MLTEIEWMLSVIRTYGSSDLQTPLDLSEGPRTDSARAHGAAFKRVLFTCGYCGGHERDECETICSVKAIEQSSSAR